jgi:hypothetical protein
MTLLWVGFGQPWLDSYSVEHNAIKNRFGILGQKVTSAYLQKFSNPRFLNDVTHLALSAYS